MSLTVPDLRWLVLLVVLAGCASQPDTRSLRHKQAMEWAAQGERAYLGGNLAQSEQYYEKALQSNTGIENADGIAANLLSLAQLHIERGEYERAEAKLQLVLTNRDNLFTSAAQADAAARRAHLALLGKQPDKAVGLAQQAQALCQACVSQAAIFNLRAQAAFALGQAQAAADLADQAAAAADKAQQSVELANAKRLLGAIRLHLKAAAEAVPPLESALALDKRLGLPRKIAEDLRLLADAQDMLGRRAEAEEYRSRERAVLDKKAP